MTLHVVALGDSTSCGEGVGLAVQLQRTWPARLTRALPGAVLLPLAAAGARVGDVRRHQLRRAVAAGPHLATLLVGLNDVTRAGFRADAYDQDLVACVLALRRTGATVLLGRLHDPCRHLPLPRRFRQAVLARVAAVNRAVDAVARRATADGAGGDVHVLDLAGIPELQSRRAWAVDRVHPTEQAHGLIAAAAAQLLVEAGLPVQPPPYDRLPEHGPGLAREAWWLSRHGAPWLLGHGREMLLPAVAPGRR